MKTPQETAKDFMWNHGLVDDFDEAERDLTQLIESERRGAMEWRPVSDEAKGGTVILVLAKESRIAALANWNPEGTSWVDENGLIGCDRAHHLEKTGVWNSCGGWFQPDEVTHWMPLPPPPEETPR